MKNMLFAVTLFATLLFASSPALAWDGAVTGKIANFEVAPGGNFGFRVALVGTPSMCTGGANWAYLNDTDSNYKVFVATLMMVKTQGIEVTIYTTKTDGYCHIGYIATSG